LTCIARIIFWLLKIITSINSINQEALAKDLQISANVTL